MSKRPEAKPVTQIPETIKRGDVVTIPAGTVMTLLKPPTLDKTADSIPWFRRCPVCWEGSGGVGNVYTTNGSTRYYKCCQSIKPGKPACGHTWTALVRTEVLKVESRTVQIDHR